MTFRASTFPRATVFCLMGLGLGIAVHPHPWEYLRYLYGQVFLASVGSSEALNAGIEWRPYGVVPFLRTNMLLLVVWVIAIVRFVAEVAGRGWNRATLEVSTWLLVMSTVFWACALLSRRFVEYWALFALLMSAWVLGPSLRRSPLGALWVRVRARRSVAT